MTNQQIELQAKRCFERYALAMTGNAWTFDSQDEATKQRWRNRVLEDRKGR